MPIYADPMTEHDSEHRQGVTIPLPGDLDVREFPEQVARVVEAFVSKLADEGTSAYPAAGPSELLFERWMGDVFTIQVVGGPKLAILYRLDRRAYLNNFSATAPDAEWVAAAQRDPKAYAESLLLRLAGKYLPRAAGG
jgi:hypothetical protein